MPAPAPVRDASTATFDAEVLAASRTAPVVVDFWAAWCGPCRTLGPVLERLARESGGRFSLVKVDVDANPELAQRFQVQGIPAVKAFVDGAVADEFTGALPEAEVRRWLAALGPGPGDEEAKRGIALLTAGELEAGRAALLHALELEPRQADALIALARLAHADGRAEEAAKLLDQVPASEQDRRSRELGALRLALGAGSLGAAEAAVRAAPDDDGAKVTLGRALAAAGRAEEGLLLLVGIVERLGRQGAGDEARQAMLAIFEAIGARSELSDRFRERLASALYR